MSIPMIFLTIGGVLVSPWLFGRMISKILDKRPYILESVLLGLFSGCYLYFMVKVIAW